MNQPDPFEAKLEELRDRGTGSLLEELRRLHAQQASLLFDLEEMRARNLELERKHEALDLDAERVHRYLDEFEVPRHLQPDQQEPGDAVRGEASELSLLGRVELILEEEDE